MATIIANGSTQLASADFTLTSGETTTLVVFSTATDEPSATVKVQQKVGSVYTTIGYLGNGQPLSQILSGPGTFRALRLASGASYAVERV